MRAAPGAANQAYAAEMPPSKKPRVSEAPATSGESKDGSAAGTSTQRDGERERSLQEMAAALLPLHDVPEVSCSS